MGSKQNQLKDIKSLLKGLVLSCPGGISVSKLRRDYRDEEGEDIPFKKFDYGDVISFLKSLNDSIVVCGNDFDSTVIPVSSSKTAQIEEMISRQRRGKPRRARRTFSHRNAQPRSYQNARPRLYQNAQSRLHQNTQSRLYQSAISNVQKESCRPPIHWPDSKSPFSRTQNNLNILPAEEGRNLSRKNNFALDWNSSVNQSETEVEKCSKATISSDVHDENYRKRNSSDFDSSYDISDTELEDLYDDNDRHKPSVNISRNEPELKSVTDINDEKGSKAQLTYFGDIPLPNKYEVFYSDDEGSINDSRSEYETHSTSGRLNDDCDTRSQGTSTLTKFNIMRKRADDFLPKAIKKNLQELISEHENGIWCCELPGIYKEQFGSELNYMQFGFYSMSALCKELSDVFHCIRPSNSDWKLFDARLPPPITEKETKPSYSFKERVIPRDDALPFFEKPVIKKKYPLNVMTLGDTLACEWLPKELEDGFLEMKVGEVYDPSKFWIMRRDKYQDLNKLMEDLQLYYIVNPSGYLIPDELLEVNLVCAGIACGEYHRVMVVKIENEKQVKVFCVDYGTVELCEKSSLRFLPRDFEDLPQQAIRSRLHNLRPKHPDILWSRNSAHLFLDSVRDKELLCIINSIDLENKILEITIYDTSTELDICINDLMVEKKVADYVIAPNTQNSIVTNSKGKVDERLVDVYLCPSFEDIEAGLVPMFSDLALLARCNMKTEVMFAPYVQAAMANPNFNAVTYSIRKIENKPLPTENDTELAAKPETDVSNIIPHEEKEDLPDIEQLNIEEEETEQNNDESLEQDVEEEKTLTDRIEIVENKCDDTESIVDVIIANDQTFTDSSNELRTVQPPPGFNCPSRTVYDPLPRQISTREPCQMPIAPVFQHQHCHPIPIVFSPPCMTQYQQQQSHNMSMVPIQQNFAPQGYGNNAAQYQQGYTQQMGMVRQPFPTHIPPPNVYHQYTPPFTPFPNRVPYSPNYPQQMNFRPQMPQPRHYPDRRADNVLEIANLVRLLEFMDDEKSLNEKDVLRQLYSTNPALIPIYRKFKEQKEIAKQKETDINIIEQLRKEISDLKAKMSSEENVKSLSERTESNSTQNEVETDYKKVKEIVNNRIMEKGNMDEPDEKDIDEVKDISNEEHQAKNKKKKLVIDVEISGKTVHIINIDGELYLSTRQVLNKFTPFSDIDLVRETFYSNYQRVWPSTRYNLNEFPEIKEQLLNFQIPFTKSGYNQIVELIKINDVSVFLKTMFIEPTRISKELCNLIESNSLQFD